jgi:hypothetical protein
MDFSGLSSYEDLGIGDMRTPETPIVMSTPLNRLFLPDFGREDARALKKDTEGFWILCKQSISRDVRLIPRFTGFFWQKTFIPIYIVRDCRNSISNPLILKYHENPSFMYVILLHELAHNNLEHPLEIARLGHERSELYVNATVREILEEPPSRAEMINAARVDENWDKMLDSGLRLRDRTVRDILYAFGIESK